MRFGNFLLGFVLVCLVLSPAVWAEDGTNGEAGPAGLDNDTLQLWDSQDPPHVLVTPQNTTKTLTGHGTSTMTETDFCTSTSKAGGIPCMDDSGKVLKLQTNLGGVLMQNLALSLMSYTITTPTSPYDDDDHKQLTNGAIREYTVGGVESDIGWYNVDPVLQIDLGASQRVGGALIHFGGGGSGIVAPSSVLLETSTNGSTWVTAYNYVNTEDVEKWFAFDFPAVSARYTRATVTRAAGTPWTMVGEMEVISADYGASIYIDPNTGVVAAPKYLSVGSRTVSNYDNWESVLQLRGINHAKFMFSTNLIDAGMWVHNTGWFGAGAGGLILGTETTHPIFFMIHGDVIANFNGLGQLEIEKTIISQNQVAVSGGHWQTGTNSTTDTVTKTNILDGTATRTLVVEGGGTLYAGNWIGFGTSSTATDTVTGTGTVSGSGTESGSSTATNTTVTTFTGTATVTITTGSTASSTQIRTVTVTGTSTGTVTATSSGTSTLTITGTGTGSSTSDGTGTVSGSGTNTSTMTGTGTGTGSNTFTVTKTQQKTDTVSDTGTITVTVTLVDTDSATAVVTGTATTTSTGTATITGTGTGSWTGTTTSTDTESSAETSADPTIVNTWFLGYVTYWLKQAASDIGGYKVLNTTVASTAAEAVNDYVSISSASGETLIATWATAIGEPGRVIPAGDWVFNAYPFDSCPTSGYYNYLKFKVYRRSFAGTETELFSVETAAHTSCYGEDPIQLLVTTYTASKIVMLASERTVIKVFGRTTNPTAINVGINYDSQYGYTHGDDSEFSYTYGLPGAFSCIETPITRGFDTPGHRDYDRVLSGAGKWIWIEPAP